MQLDGGASQRLSICRHIMQNQQDVESLSWLRRRVASFVALLGTYADLRLFCEAIVPRARQGCHFGGASARRAGDQIKSAHLRVILSSFPNFLANVQLGNNRRRNFSSSSSPFDANSAD